MACTCAFLGTETVVTDQTKDVEEERAQIQKQLSETPEVDEDEAVDEASLAPPGHLGERMNERERP